MGDSCAAALPGLSRRCSCSGMATAMLLLAALPSALGFAASPGRLFLGRSASGVSVRAASGVPARSPLRPARFGAGGARMMSTPTETAKAEKDTSVVLNPDFTFKMDDIVSVCKRRGFVFQSSEIYNGFNGFYDYGPLGVELKNNIKKIWWRDMVTARSALLPPTSISASWPPSGGSPARGWRVTRFDRAARRCTGARTWWASIRRSSRRPRSGSRPGMSKASLTLWSTARCCPAPRLCTHHPFSTLRPVSSIRDCIEETHARPTYHAGNPAATRSPFPV